MAKPQINNGRPAGASMGIDASLDPSSLADSNDLKHQVYFDINSVPFDANLENSLKQSNDSAPVDNSGVTNALRNDINLQREQNSGEPTITPKQLSLSELIQGGVKVYNQMHQTPNFDDPQFKTPQAPNNQPALSNEQPRVKSSNDYFDDAMNGKAWTGGDFTRSNIRQWLKSKGINPYSIGGSMRRELRLAMESGDQRRIDTILQTISNSTGKSVFNDAINGRPQPTTPEQTPEQKPEEKPGWSMMTDYGNYDGLKNTSNPIGKSVYQLQANINNAMKGTEGWTDIATDGYAGSNTSAAMDKLKLTNADAYNQLYSQYGHLLNTYQPRAVTEHKDDPPKGDWHSKYSFLNRATRTKLGGYNVGGLTYYKNWRVYDPANNRKGYWSMRGDKPVYQWDSSTTTSNNGINSHHVTVDPITHGY